MADKDDKGRFAAGNNANPAGRPKGSGKGWQMYGVRAAQLLDNGLPVEHLFDLTARELMDHYGQRDVMIILHLRKIFSDNNGEERERLLGRVEGAARQSVDISVKDTSNDVDFSRLSNKERKQMRRALGKAMGKLSPLDEDDDDSDQ